MPAGQGPISMLRSRISCEHVETIRRHRRRVSLLYDRQIAVLFFGTGGGMEFWRGRVGTTQVRPFPVFRES